MMTKPLFSAAALALALSAGSAFAADLPSHKAPPYIPPPPPMWTGFYVGLNAGYTFSDSNSIWVNSSVLAIGGPPVSIVGNTLVAAAAAATQSALLPGGNNGGFIGGGQIGYNWQFASNFVAGVEADIQGVAASRGWNSVTGATSLFPQFPAGDFWASQIQASKSLDYLGTVRGRIGYLFTPTLLVYGTGGLAYGGVNTGLNITSGPVGPVAPIIFGPMFGSSAFSDTRVGWTAGGGLEWMFMPNWSAKVEYLYYDLGSVALNSTPLASLGTGFGFGAPFAGALAGRLAFATSVAASTRFNGHIIRAGVNYHFNWGAPAAVLAKY
jgi:outer membrane immunogenic protein